MLLRRTPRPSAPLPSSACGDRSTAQATQHNGSAVFNGGMMVLVAPSSQSSRSLCFVERQSNQSLLSPNCLEPPGCDSRSDFAIPSILPFFETFHIFQGHLWTHLLTQVDRNECLSILWRRGRPTGQATTTIPKRRQRLSSALWRRRGRLLE